MNINQSPICEKCGAKMTYQNKNDIVNSKIVPQDGYYCSQCGNSHIDKTIDNLK